MSEEKDKYLKDFHPIDIFDWINSILKKRPIYKVFIFYIR